MRELPWGRRVAWTAAALAGTVVLAMPWLDAGPHLWASAGAYAAHWSFNGFLWPIVHGLAPAAARPLLWALGAVGTAYAWWRARTLAGVWWQIALIFLTTTPTAHPWYGLWLLAPAVLLERRWAMWATTFGMHGYLVLSTVDASGAWTETPCCGLPPGSPSLSWRWHAVATCPCPTTRPRNSLRHTGPRTAR
jgi:hypothetical protein